MDQTHRPCRLWIDGVEIPSARVISMEVEFLFSRYDPPACEAASMTDRQTDIARKLVEAALAASEDEQG